IGVWFLLFIVGILFGMAENLRQQKERHDEDVAKRTAQGEAEPPANQDAEKGRGRRPRLDDAPMFNPDNWFFATVRAIHYVMPRTRDLDYLMTRVLQRDLLT